MPTSIQPVLFASPKQVAATIGHHEKTIRRWCYAGKIRARRAPGGTIRIEVDESGWPLLND